MAAYSHPKQRYGHRYGVDEDNYHFILYELFLSILSVLLKGRHFGFARALMDYEYNVATAVDSDEFSMEGIRAFNHDMKSLDGIRNDRLKLGKASVAADMIKERATHPKAPFKDLLEVDAILLVRLFFGPQATTRYWNPRLSVYLGTSSLPFFMKATTDSGFNVFQRLIPVQGKVELAKAFSEMVKSRTWEGMTNRRWDVYYGDALNIERIIKAGEKS